MPLPAVSSKTILPSLTVAVFGKAVHPGVTFACALVCIAMLFVTAPFVQAQQPDSDDEVVRVNTNLVVFPIRVKDKRGSAATKLTEQDLSLKDPDQVTSSLYLYAGADRLTLVFALDQSGSLREVISQQRGAAVALFKRFGERSQVAVIHFAERPALVAPFGNDLAKAEAAFEFPVKRNQRTAIFDAAAAAIGAFDVLPRFRSERRIVVLISDGLDNASISKASAVIQSASAKHISFYIIHLPLFEPRDGRLAVRTPAKGFRDLAERTGGKYFLVGDAKTALMQQGGDATPNLAPVFRAIEDDLRSQYLLGYYAGPGSRDGRDHQFTIGMPPGVEYQMGNYGYAREHKFFIKVPKPTKKGARP